MKIVKAKVANQDYSMFKQQVFSLLQTLTDESKDFIEIEKLPNCLHMKLIEEGYMVTKLIKKQYVFVFFKKYVKIYRISRQKQFA